MTKLNPSNDSDWERFAGDFDVAPGTIYLNHGSFGIPTKQVLRVQHSFSKQLNANPMDFFLVQFEDLLTKSLRSLGNFLVTAPSNLCFVDNATYAMSLVAAGFPLSEGDEVIISDHEYVPVTRMWQYRCDQVGAKLVVASLPQEIVSDEQIVESLRKRISSKTKLLVISHITSPTALILPIKEICQCFSSVEIPVCVDGPHALAQVDVNLDALGCDFYSASCHKWLSAPLGSGFLYVHPRWQKHIAPLVKGWGRLPPANVDSWCDQFLWAGTRDVSYFLAIPAAIEYLESVGLENFRQRSFGLASYAEAQLTELFKTKPLADRKLGFYGSMAHVPLPPGEWSNVAKQLKQQSGFEVMVNQFAGRWFVRVSCHLYNNASHVDQLVKSRTGSVNQLCADQYSWLSMNLPPSAI